MDWSGAIALRLYVISLCGGRSINHAQDFYLCGAETNICCIVWHAWKERPV